MSAWLSPSRGARRSSSRRPQTLTAFLMPASASPTTPRKPAVQYARPAAAEHRHAEKRRCRFPSSCLCSTWASGGSRRFRQTAQVSLLLWPPRFRLVAAASAAFLIWLSHQIRTCAANRGLTCRAPHATHAAAAVSAGRWTPVRRPLRAAVLLMSRPTTRLAICPNPPGHARRELVEGSRVFCWSADGPVGERPGTCR